MSVYDEAMFLLGEWLGERGCQAELDLEAGIVEVKWSGIDPLEIRVYCPGEIGELEWGLAVWVWSGDPADFDFDVVWRGCLGDPAVFDGLFNILVCLGVLGDSPCESEEGV